MEIPLTILPASRASCSGRADQVTAAQAMANRVEEFFRQYERTFNRALAGEIGMDEVAQLYAAEFVTAWPGGVMTGKNDEQLRETLAQGYERYRALGTRGMRLRGVRLSPIDDLHCLAHVAWTATYLPEGRDEEVTIDFDVHYFVRDPAGEPQVFGWVSGDEEALMKEHGIG